MAYPATPVEERLIDRIALDENNCWLWEGSLNKQGYGQMWVGAKRDGTWRIRRTHRIAYELFRGAIPKGLQIDHLCRVRRCANPWHLEAVTQRENIRREVIARGDLCKYGHSLADAYRYSGHRYCRTCKIERERSRRAAKKMYPGVQIE